MQNEKKQLNRFKLLQGSYEQNSPTETYLDPVTNQPRPKIEIYQAPRPLGDGKGKFDPETIVVSDLDLEARFNWPGMPKKFERVHDTPQAQVAAAKPALVDYNALKAQGQKELLAFCERYELDVPEGKTSKDDLLAVIKAALGA